MSRGEGELRIGTSGWVYAHWRGVLYPPGLGSARWLARYAELFDTVELNATFYRLPTPTAVDRWRDGTPEGFVFAAKGSRFLTHMKRLGDSGPGLRRYFTPIRRLGAKLGPILWQIPPQMSRPDLERLEAFLRRLPRGPRYAFEFRHPAWYTPAVCELLDAHGVAFCEHDHVGVRPPWPTGGFRYLRFHGAGARYADRYGRDALAPFARDLRRWRHAGRGAYVYFNNDIGGAAVHDALDLKALMGLIPRRPHEELLGTAGAPVTGR